MHVIVYVFTLTDEGARKSGDEDTSKILKEVHNMLHSLIKRVEGTEKELKSMKVRLSTPSSDSSSASKRTVPLVVKVSTCTYLYMVRNSVFSSIRLCSSNPWSWCK